MKFKETDACNCRYGDIAKKVWGDWDVVYEDSYNDYQGHATLVVTKGGAYCFYEWYYGSCSGCDDWEARGLSDDQIEMEMRGSAMWLKDEVAMKTWLEMLQGNPIGNEGSGGLAYSIDQLSGGLLKRINAIRKHFDMGELGVKD
jgi:hypothetical protein